MQIKSPLGAFLRKARERKAKSDPRFSLRQVAGRVRVQPSYLSKIERGEQLPGDELIHRIAAELGEESDRLLMLARKVPADLTNIILARPEAVAELLRSVKDAPAERIHELARQVRDGKW